MASDQGGYIEGVIGAKLSKSHILGYIGPIPVGDGKLTGDGFAAQPTRGVDIGATEYIHQRLLEQRAAGASILLISEDLDEIRALSDRIAVIYEGKIVGVVDGRTATAEDLGLMMTGGTRVAASSGVE